MVRATADAWLAAGGAAAGPSSDELADDLTALVWDGLSSVAVPASGQPGLTPVRRSTTGAAAGRVDAVVVRATASTWCSWITLRSKPSRDPAMYRPHTLAVPSPTSATHSSQWSTRLRHQSRSVSA